MAADAEVPPRPDPPDASVTLRRGALTFVGSVVAAASGFLLAIVVARGLGTAGAGVFFSIVSLFMIVSTVLKLGTDTAQLWRLPRLLATGRTADLRPSVRLALVPTTALSLVAGATMVVAAGPIARLTVPGAGPEAATQVAWAGVALAAMAPMSVLVAVTRGLGRVRPFVAIQNVVLPVGRLVAVAAVLALGAGGVAVLAAWSLPVLVCAALAALVVRAELRRLTTHPTPSGEPTAPSPLAEQRRELWGFAGPRAVTASIEIVLVTVNVLVVGILIGPVAAGVFGALSRFVTTGQLVEQTVRILVAPRFSALLGTGDVAGASRLYRTTTPWVVLGSWPVFLVLALGAPAVLRVFGDDFTAGAGALAVLAATLAVSQLAGNVQTVLLMSGHSNLQLLNRIVSVVTLLGLDLVLVPRHGVLGAAIAWAASILVDTLLAVIEVRFVVGLHLTAPLVWRILPAATLAFGLPTYVVVHRLDGGLVALVCAVAVGFVVYLPMVWRWRGALRLAEPAPRTAVAERE